ncbi:MAG: PQQ-binding-like beta-propeller repeat protein [Phycisphaerales bacterium]|nr:MAG: PQQ-binding-like beta-propeller repeat protein [Phycisphaerales bacterium]
MKYGTKLTDWYCVSWLATIAFVALFDETKAQWQQWGGSNRDFTVEATGLADKWPEGGPRKLWKRELGDGYSSIVVDGGLLYTMYRAGSEQASVALDVLTGRTVWEQRNPSPYDPSKDAEIGRGPNSTPLISGNRIFTIGTQSVIHCFDKQTGKILWRRDLVDELGARVFRYGYGSSPLAYKELLIAVVDRPRRELVGHGQETILEAGEARSVGQARTLMAFDQRSGEIVWSSQDFIVDHSSPLLLNFRGEDQIVLYLNEGIVAVAPDNGQLLWHYEVERHGHDMTPLWLDGDIVVT